MVSSSAQKAAKAINLLMKFSPGDQQSLLEVIDDYFTSNNGCDSDSNSQRMNKQVKYIYYYTTQNKRIRIIMDACICR